VTRCFLDARAMEHPEPLERAITILRTLEQNSYLYMLHRKNPLPLIALAEEHALNHLSWQDEKEEWHILITPNREIDLKTLLECPTETA